jgi:acetyl-CoA C-acetyltransferase
MSLRGRAAITGFGETTFMKDSGRDVFQLASEASAKALRDAGLNIKDIDGLITVDSLTITGNTNVQMAEYLGIKPTYSAEITVYGASSGVAVKQAAEVITAGKAKHILVVASDLSILKFYKNASSTFSLGNAYETPFFGRSANIRYALIANLHSHLYGTTVEQRAKVAVDQRFNANHNENSLFGDKPLTIEDVVNSPIVSSPIHMLEIVYPCEGACAVVVSRSEDAYSITQTPVFIDGAGFYSGHSMVSQSDMFHNGLVSPIKKAAQQSFEMAGITTKEVDVCGFYDCYTIAVLITLEDMGFCKKGEGGRFVEEHDLTFKGDFPLNTSGGQLSVGQPGDAGGMINLIEVVRQLMGRAESRQVPHAEIGVVNTNGGVFSTECTLVLRRG